jgi:hypothetical protein
MTVNGAVLPVWPSNCYCIEQGLNSKSAVPSKTYFERSDMVRIPIFIQREISMNIIADT